MWSNLIPSFLRSRKGSAIVEAAMIFPIVILILFAIISTSLSMLERTEVTCADCKEKVMEEPHIAGMDVFSALRAGLAFSEDSTETGIGK